MTCTSDPPLGLWFGSSNLRVNIVNIPSNAFCWIPTLICGQALYIHVLLYPGSQDSAVSGSFSETPMLFRCTKVNIVTHLYDDYLRWILAVYIIIVLWCLTFAFFIVIKGKVFIWVPTYMVEFFFRWTTISHWKAAHKYWHNLAVVVANSRPMLLRNQFT